VFRFTFHSTFSPTESPTLSPIEKSEDAHISVDEADDDFDDEDVLMWSSPSGGGRKNCRSGKTSKRRSFKRGRDRRCKSRKEPVWFSWVSVNGWAARVSSSCVESDLRRKIQFVLSKVWRMWEVIRVINLIWSKPKVVEKELYWKRGVCKYMYYIEDWVNILGVREVSKQFIIICLNSFTP
jgi:hypothetical protein